jgi:hypothetical protein
VVLDPGPYPFRGEVIWLTPEQGGRRTGVPEPSTAYSYAHVAHVPPQSFQTGSASFVLRGWRPHQWRSPAEGKWLIAENAGDQLVAPGAVIVVTEGARITALFLVEHVHLSS